MNDLHFTTDHGPLVGEEWVPIARDEYIAPDHVTRHDYAVIVVESGQTYIVARYADDNRRRLYQWHRPKFTELFTRVL